MLEFTSAVDAAFADIFVAEDVSEAANGPPMTAPAATKTSSPAIVCIRIDFPDLTL